MSRTPFVLCTQVTDAPGGAGPAADSSPSSTTAPASPGFSSPAGAGAGAGLGPAAPARPTFAYPEDRSDWIPRHRYNQTSQEVQRLRQDMQQQQAAFQARARAFMGIDQPENPQRAQLTAAMKEMFPGMAPFIDNPKLAERFMQSAQQSGESSSFQDAYWGRHGQEMTMSAVEEYAKAAGVKVDDLPPSRVEHMARQLLSYIGADPSGQRQQAYERRDPQFIPAFIADLTGVFVAPLRRQAAAATAANFGRVQNLPSSRGPAGVVGSGQPAERPKGKAIHEAARRAIMEASGG